MRRSFYHVAMSVFLLGVAGCYNYDPPQAATDTDTYTKRKLDNRKVLPPGTRVLTLEMAQELAVANSPSFEAQFHAVQAAWAAYKQRFGGYFPTISAVNSVGQTFNNYSGRVNNDSDSLPNNNNLTSQTGLTASLNVFDGLQREMTLLSYKYQALGQEAVKENARRVLLKSVAEAYNNILLSIEQSRIAVSDRDFQLKQLKDAQYKYDAGASPLSDVLNFKVNVNNATNSQITAQYSFNFYRYALAQLMGIPDSTLPDELKYSPIDSIPDEELPDINIYLDAALNNRPDLKQYREALQTAKYNLYASWGAYSPTVTATAGGYYNTTMNHYDNNDPSHTYYNNTQGTYSVNTNWVLFNGGTREFQVRQAQALVAQAQFNVANQWITVVQEVRTAYDTYKQNVKQARLYQETQALVTKQRDLVEEEYKAGNKELTRLNEAQNTLVSAETNLVIALVNVMSAKAQLESATNSNNIGKDIQEIRARARSMAPAPAAAASTPSKTAAPAAAKKNG